MKLCFCISFVFGKIASEIQILIRHGHGAHQTSPQLQQTTNFNIVQQSFRQYNIKLVEYSFKSMSLDQQHIVLIWLIASTNML